MATDERIGTYSIRVWNDLGTNTLFADYNMPASITLQPSVSPTRPGSTVQLQVEAVGNGPLSFEWHFNNEAILGATGSEYSYVAAPDSSGNYSVVVSNEFGTDTSTAVPSTVFDVLHAGKHWPVPGLVL